MTFCRELTRGHLLFHHLPGPHPFEVYEGEELDLIVRFSHDSAVMQFGLERVEEGNE